MHANQRCINQFYISQHHSLQVIHRDNFEFNASQIFLEAALCLPAASATLNLFLLPPAEWKGLAVRPHFHLFLLLLLLLLGANMRVEHRFSGIFYILLC